MFELADMFDAYSRKARLLPALLVTMPAGISLALLLPGFGHRSIAALVVAAGLPIFAANAVRSSGKRLEAKLVKTWGGLPTTRMLRLSEPSNNPHLLLQRRRRLEELTGDTLPTREDESTDAAGADLHYVAATRRLIPRIREQKDRFGLLEKENTDYGFRRNLLALKPGGLGVLALLGVTDIVAFIAGVDVELVLGLAVVHLLCTLGWLITVRRRWVLEQAETYAERLFETLEEPALTGPHES